jgi:hypothetical protein
MGENHVGTNFFAAFSEYVSIGLANNDGFAVSAICTGDPNSVALEPNVYAVGCFITRQDILSGNNVYQNIGTLTNPSWQLNGSGGGGNSFDSSRPTTRAGVPVVNVGGSTVQDFLNGYFFPAVGPTITLNASPSAGIREKGNSINIALSAIYTKQTNDITVFSIYKNSTLLYSDPSPSPTGGTASYTDNGIADTVSYYATATDSTLTTTSNTLNYTYVYPFYYGVGAPGLDATAIAALTKLIQTKSNKTTVTSPTSQVYYFSYPQSYGNLTSILDQSGFETLGDYTLRTVTITGLDSNPIVYNVYEFNNLTTQVNFSNTYKF